MVTRIAKAFLSYSKHYSYIQTFCSLLGWEAGIVINPGHPSVHIQNGYIQLQCIYYTHIPPDYSDSSYQTFLPTLIHTSIYGIHCKSWYQMKYFQPANILDKDTVQLRHDSNLVQKLIISKFCTTVLFFIYQIRLNLKGHGGVDLAYLPPQLMRLSSENVHNMEKFNT